jgi:FkbM family methyltransferase
MLAGIQAKFLRTICRGYPFYSGCTRIPNSRSAVRLTVGMGISTTRLRDGSLARVKVDDYVGRALYFAGEYDPKITWVLQRVLFPGDCVLDVGANMGVYALAAARIVGPDGSVHAFEPQPDLAELLRESARLNNYTQLTVHACALSDRDGESRLFLHTHNTGAATLEQSHSAGHGVSVPIRHSGNYLDSLRLQRPRLIKIDVEGHEPVIVAAALDFLRRQPPQIVVFESRNSGSVPFPERPLVQLLASLGYEFGQIPKAMLRMHICRLQPRGPALREGFDFLAFLPGSSAATRLGIV